MSDVTFDLDIKQVGHLIDLGVCVSKDKARQILESVRIEAKGNEVILIATDSYRLGVIALTVEKVRGRAEFNVPHAQLVRALRWLRTELNMEVPVVREEARFQFTFEDKQGRLEVTGVWDSKYLLPTFTINKSDGKFPGWRSLFNGQPWRASLRESLEHDWRRGFAGMKLPTLSAAFLADMNKLIGPESRRSAEFGSVQLSHTATPGTDAALKPWCLTTQDNDGDVEITYLIMPVRT